MRIERLGYNPEKDQPLGVHPESKQVPGPVDAIGPAWNPETGLETPVEQPNLANRTKESEANIKTADNTAESVKLQQEQQKAQAHDTAELTEVRRNLETIKENQEEKQAA